MSNQGELIHDLKKIMAELDSIKLELLYMRAANKLGGRSVELRWEKPFLADTRGIALRDGERGLIFVNPALDPEQRFKTFIHECSHMKLHFPYLADVKSFTPSGKKAPAPHRLTKKAKTDPVFNRNEEEARELADRWLTLVESCDSIREKLALLLETPDL